LNQECPPRFPTTKENIVTVMIGIDPHKATHTATAIDETAVELGRLEP
jgi:hypothetical protein